MKASTRFLGAALAALCLLAALALLAAGCSMGNERDSSYLGAMAASPTESSAPAAQGPPSADERAKEYLESEAGAHYSDMPKGSSGSASTRSSSVATPPPASTLKAGSHNDNDEYVRYLEYLARFDHLRVPHFDVAERYIVQWKDEKGRSIPNLRFSAVSSSGVPLGTYTTYSSGEAVIFPNATQRISGDSITVSARIQGRDVNHTFPRGTEKVVSIVVPGERSLPATIPLDILFVLDTTGSMADEIQKLRDTIVSIHHSVVRQSRLPVRVRFGMVLYRDFGDEYVTQVEPLTADIEAFQNALFQVNANGGGDTPEEMEQALDKAMNAISWSADGLRLVFLMTDAPPHWETPSSPDYMASAKTAAAKGVKIFPVGASGLDEVGEYVLRQLGVVTMGHYIFLTYGEQGESTGSPEAKVSHHTGANYSVQMLDILIVRMIRQELSYLVDPALVAEEEIPEPQTVNAQALTERVQNLIEQLCHQAKDRLAKTPLIAVFPLNCRHPRRLGNVADYVKDCVEQAMRDRKHNVLEREDLATAMKEQMLKHNMGMDDDDLAQVASQMKHADVYFSGKLYPLGESVVIHMQIVDVDTLEKLGVARILWTPE